MVGEARYASGGVPRAPWIRCAAAVRGSGIGIGVRLKPRGCGVKPYGGMDRERDRAMPIARRPPGRRYKIFRKPHTPNTQQAKRGGWGAGQRITA